MVSHSHPVEISQPLHQLFHFLELQDPTDKERIFDWRMENIKELIELIDSFFMVFREVGSVFVFNVLTESFKTTLKIFIDGDCLAGRHDFRKVVSLHTAEGNEFLLFDRQDRHKYVIIGNSFYEKTYHLNFNIV